MNEKSDCYRLFPIKKKKKNVFKFKNAQKKNEAGSDAETCEYDLKNKRVSFRINTSFYLYFVLSFNLFQFTE